MCLVSMPFAPLPRPLPALGLLQAALDQAGIAAQSCYFNLWFAKRHGSRAHDRPYRYLKFYFGDWLFGEAAFGARPDTDRRYLNALARYMLGKPEPDPAAVQAVVEGCTNYRRQASEFVRLAARYLLASRAPIIGCSSNFQQHGASLAILREVRRLAPDVITLLGGANCEGPMGLASHRCFPWVDYVVCGEGEGLIASLVQQILEHGREIPLAALAAGVWGPANRARGEAGYQRPHMERFAICTDLNASPVPNYQPFFDWVRRLGLESNIRPGLPIEGSRGCWWGRCSFCGLNGERLRQRGKRTERLIAEMDALELRHQCRDFELVDNVPPPRLLRELTIHLAKRLADPSAEQGPLQPRTKGPPRRLFCEIRAGLSRDQVRALADAGIHYVQVGLEGLHSELLQLMNKGVEAWQNLQLLKWTREFGILSTYNLLWGLPGERDDWHRQTAEWLPAIEHLAPGVVLRLRFDRFSDYHRDPEAYGLRLRPHPAMPLVYPLGEADLTELSYFFEHDPVPIGPDGRYAIAGHFDFQLPPGVARLCDVTTAWFDTFFRAPLQPILARSDAGEGLDILDTRGCAASRHHRLKGPLRALYELGDAAVRFEDLQAGLARAPTQGPVMRLTDHQVSALCGELLDARLALALDDRLISLAIRGEQPAFPRHQDFPGGRISAHWRGAASHTSAAGQVST
ncbi:MULTISPECIES: RiPP maturation radical SAM C-methyltransferase [Thiorhodovibrio]|uniref:RiPP maturation radical SAM C-methyltransferase n=1 Tax=Thiorhodovibrio TaxID=61593 RepID=UPI00191358AD|nr:RiPP maturation radical SAM C-methyltransferase [Thiorhodovibrio litoralis]